VRLLVAEARRHAREHERPRKQRPHADCV
jgi:hypothetical protein